MKNLIATLLADERGFVLSAELILITTVVVFGLIAGLSGVRAALLGELSDVAGAFRSLDQSYSYRGLSTWKDACIPKASVAGSAFVDACDLPVESFDLCVEEPCPPEMGDATPVPNAVPAEPPAKIEDHAVPEPKPNAKKQQSLRSGEYVLPEGTLPKFD